MGSVKSRKVSTQSLQSNASTEEMPTSSSYAIFEESATGEVGGTASAPAEEYQDNQTDYVADVCEDANYSRNMPWIKVPNGNGTFPHVLSVGYCTPLW